MLVAILEDIAVNRNSHLETEVEVQLPQNEHPTKHSINITTTIHACNVHAYATLVTQSSERKYPHTNSQPNPELYLSRTVFIVKLVS